MDRALPDTPTVLRESDYRKAVKRSKKTSGMTYRHARLTRLSQVCFSRQAWLLQNHTQINTRSRMSNYPVYGSPGLNGDDPGEWLPPMLSAVGVSGMLALRSLMCPNDKL